MTTYNLHPVAEFVNFDERDTKLLAQSINIYYTRLAQAINTLMAASGGNPSPGAITAGQIGYGSSTNTLTSDSTFLWDTTNKIFTETGSIPTRVMTENIDSTSMTEAKEQPFHQWQITNKVRTPGNNGAIHFGAVTSYALATANAAYSGHSKISVSGWFYWDAVAVGQTIWSVNNTGFVLEVGSNIGGAGRCLLFGNGIAIAGATPSINQWHHVAASYDDSAAGGTQTIYLDGALYGQNTGGGAQVAANIASGHQLIIGAATTGGTEQFVGRVDEVQIYADYVFSASDVAALYNLGAGTASTVNGGTGLIGQYHADSSAGTTLIDSSSNALNCTLGGTSTPTWITGIIVGSPTLATQNVISSQDGASNNETQIITLGSVAGTVNILGTLESNGVTGIGNHPLLDGAVDNDTLAGTVVRGDVIVGNSTPKWARLAKGTSGQVLRSDGTDVAYGAIDGATVTGGMTDVTNGNVSSTRHGFAPKSPADATQFLNGAATPAFAAVKDSDLSTSDVTTNNVSSTKHGFAPKSPADATQFLNGAATPAFAAVKDSDLSTSDITTNNVSTLKHGFTPKGDGVAGHFLDSTGAWSAPAGAGNVTTSATLTADALILGNGTTDLTVMASLGTSGQILQSQGAGLPPHWVTGGGGTGTVTNTGTLTANELILGNGGVDVTSLGSAGTTTQVLHGNAAGAPSFSAVSLTADVSGTLPTANGGTGGTGGAYTRLSQIVTASSQSTVTFSGISGSYNALELIFESRDTATGTSGSIIRVEVNGDTTAANYTSTARSGSQNAAAVLSSIAASTKGAFIATQPNDGNTAGIFNSGRLLFVGYAGTAHHKRVFGNYASDTATDGVQISTFEFRWASTSAITSLVVTTDGTAFKDGSVFTLYGLP